MEKITMYFNVKKKSFNPKSVSGGDLPSPKLIFLLNFALFIGETSLSGVIYLLFCINLLCPLKLVLRPCTDKNKTCYWYETNVVTDISFFMLQCWWDYNKIKSMLKIQPHSKIQNLDIRKLLQSKLYFEKKNVMVIYFPRVFLLFLAIETRCKLCNWRQCLVFIMLTSFLETNTAILTRTN